MYRMVVKEEKIQDAVVTFPERMEPKESIAIAVGHNYRIDKKWRSVKDYFCYHMNTKA